MLPCGFVLVKIVILSKVGKTLYHPEVNMGDVKIPRGTSPMTA